MNYRKQFVNWHQIVCGIILALVYYGISRFIQPYFNDYLKGAVIDDDSAFLLVSCIFFILIYLFTRYKACAFAFLITITAGYIIVSLI